jgi:hypothetical protein
MSGKTGWAERVEFAERGEIHTECWWGSDKGKKPLAKSKRR